MVTLHLSSPATFLLLRKVSDEMLKYICGILHEVARRASMVAEASLTTVSAIMRLPSSGESLFSAYLNVSFEYTRSGIWQQKPCAYIDGLVHKRR